MRVLYYLFAGNAVKGKLTLSIKNKRAVLGQTALFNEDDNVNWPYRNEAHACHGQAQLARVVRGLETRANKFAHATRNATFSRVRSFSCIKTRRAKGRPGPVQ